MNNWFDFNTLRYVGSISSDMNWSDFSNLVGIPTDGVIIQDFNFAKYLSSDNLTEVLVPIGDGGNGVSYNDVLKAKLLEGKYVQFKGEQYFAKLMSGSDGSGGYKNSEYDKFQDNLYSYDYYACRDGVTRRGSNGRKFSEYSPVDETQVRGAVVLCRHLNSMPTFDGLVDTNLGEISEKPANIQFTLNDKDINDTLTLLINVDGETYDSYQSDTNTLTCDFEFEFFDRLAYGDHIVTFVGMDSKNAIVSANVTFKKIKEPILTIPEDSDLQSTVLALKELDIEIGYQCSKLEKLFTDNDVVIEPSENNLSSFIDKVVEKGFGVKVAKGTSLLSSDTIPFKLITSNDGTWNKKYVIIPKLKFVPSMIVVRRGKTPEWEGDRQWASITILNDLNGFKKCDACICGSGNVESTYSYGYIVDNKIQLEDGTFRIPVEIHKSVTDTTTPFEWVAYE